jgi:hypothetical protein
MPEKGFKITYRLEVPEAQRQSTSPSRDLRKPRLHNPEHKMTNLQELRQSAKMVPTGEAILEFLESYPYPNRTDDDPEFSFSFLKDALVAKFGRRVMEFTVWEFVTSAIFAVMKAQGFRIVNKARTDPHYHYQKFEARILRAMLSGLDERDVLCLIDWAERVVETGTYERCILSEEDGVTDWEKLRLEAKAVPDGEAILEFLNKEHIRDRLEEAAAEDAKPLMSYIKNDLLAKFGPQIMDFAVCEFITKTIYAVIREKGYQFLRNGMFEAVLRQNKEEADFLHAIICGLNKAQLECLISAANDRWLSLNCEDEDDLYEPE